MKKIFGLSCFAAALFSMGLSSCQSEDMIVPADVNEDGELVEVIAIVSRDDDSRSIKDHAENGNITTKWEVGDRLVALSENGSRNLGILEYKYNEKAQAEAFSGSLRLRASDTNAKIYYLGKKAEATTAIMNSVDFDLSETNGALASFSDFDIAGANAKIKRDDLGQALLTATLRSALGQAHFYINLPAGVNATGNEIVKVSGANVNNAFTFNFADGSFTNLTEGTINVQPDWTVGASNEGQIFMMLPALENVATEFTLEVNGKTYKAALPARKYNANKIFNGGTKHGKDIYFSENGSAFELVYKAEGAENVPAADRPEGIFLPKHTFTVTAQEPTKEGFKFLGWADTENGSVAYTAGASITLQQPEISKTIYAVWEEEWHYTTYTLFLGENGKDGGSIDQYYPAYQTPWNFTYSDNWDVPTLNGYEFLGWADSKDATTPDYKLGDTITTGGKDVPTKTVYPVWKASKQGGNIGTPDAPGSDY